MLSVSVKTVHTPRISHKEVSQANEQNNEFTISMYVQQLMCHQYIQPRGTTLLIASFMEQVRIVSFWGALSHRSIQVDESERLEQSCKSFQCLGIATLLSDLHQCLQDPVSWQRVDCLDKCHKGCQKVFH